jgi:hypothetical protein
MGRSPSQDLLSRATRRLVRELEDAAACMADVANKLDFNTIGRSKWRLIRCYDRAVRAAADGRDALQPPPGRNRT